MKTKWNVTLILVIFCTLLAFKVGERVELTDFLNARRTPNFITKKNIVKTLSIGTTGEIKQIKKFHSGNMGFKMAITSGPLRGSTYWVYYNVKDPAIKVTSKKTKKEIASKDISEETANGKNKPDAELEDDHEGIEDPEDTEIKTHLTNLGNMKAMKEAMDEVNNDIVLNPCEAEGQLALENAGLTSAPTRLDDMLCANARTDELVRKCGLKIFSSTNKSEEDVDVLDIDLNSNSITQKSKISVANSLNGNDLNFEFVQSRKRPKLERGHPACSSFLTNINNFELCRNHQTVESFLLRNEGPNSMVDIKDGFTSRVFMFNSEDNSLSDSHLEINEVRMSKTGVDANYRLVFFPRTQAPSAKVIGDKIELTLPNKEKVIFDKKSKEIIGGVLSETKMNTNPNQPLGREGVNYKGDGLVIRVDNIKLNTAIISKGTYTCKVNAMDLWYNDPKTKRTLFKEEYATDDGINRYIQKHCGFGF